ncbi:ADP-ribosyl-[dinitrogen reductase] hydrolase [Pelomonas cellulosilytica]|uniref:ADP-ribosyl-[dinitrogen reductase] hydrolase n=1 Tax=Pelomonas cellulosilytica TaxID=2906762 RepID=A0ABS8Y405_9BURK|nr:ADP-ribosyl-[dinitrogen reductase] hydrolase [Pelomonas sp. P8]MCE4556800.1 ADP-ribosyl-[dinitrogen reductase] hydrolase [Pelomonas sp. P8]
MTDTLAPPAAPRWLPRFPPGPADVAGLLTAAGGLPAVMDRALGAYLGLALGDALGATVEFMTPREITLRFGVHDRIQGGGWLRLKSGQVTDDTTMSLALGEAICQCTDATSHDLLAVADAFVAWWRARPVDCGNTCRRGILRYRHDGTLAGPPSESDGGNGAAMRVLPAALATLGDPAGFAALALGQARITHHHPLSDSATLQLGALVQAAVLGVPRAGLRQRIDAWIVQRPAFRFDPYPGRASGYIVDTVQTVLHAFTRHDCFADAVVDAVNRGEDADTTGALVGMLAGACCGASRLPRDWLARLQAGTRQAVCDQASALVAHALQ